MSDELPEGWISAKLDTLNDPTAPICYGVLKPGDSSANGIPMLRVKDVRDGWIDTSDILHISASLDAEFKRSRVQPGDVLVSVQGSVGRVALVPPELVAANISRTIARIRPVDAALGPWLGMALRSREVQVAMGAVVGGTTRDSLNIRDLRELDIALPPLPEQRRIVAKVEELLAEVIRAKARITKVQAILKRFRQAVLAAACSGELTRQWREESEPVEAGLQLLHRLLQRPERRRRYAGGFRTRDDLDLPELPDEWTWADLRLLSDPAEALCYGVVQPGAEVSEGVPLVRAGDLHDLPAALPSLRLISKSVHESYARSILRGGEVLVTVVGANVGTSALAPDETRGFNIARAVAKIPIREVNGEYVLLWLQSSLAARWMFGDAREVARPTLNIEQLETLPVPLPPINEQAEIVRLASACLSWAKAAARRATNAQEQIGRLPQAILSRAFSGELVSTEADLARLEGRDYEPAALLLERIRTTTTSEALSASKRAAKPKRRAPA